MDLVKKGVAGEFNKAGNEKNEYMPTTKYTESIDCLFM